MDTGAFILVFVIGLFCGGFGAVVGSSLLVIFPSLVFLGLPPHVALGTGKLSAFFRDVPALVNYHKYGKVDYRTGVAFTLSAVAGTLLASWFALSLSPRTLEIVISICMVVIAALIIANPSAGLDSRTRKSTAVHLHRVVIPGFFVGLYDGIFGGGVSILIILLFVFAAGHDYIRAVGTSKVSNIITCTAFVGVFASHGKVDYLFAVPLVLGMSIGGYAGSRFALRLGNRFVRGLLMAMVFAMALKLLLF